MMSQGTRFRTWCWPGLLATALLTQAVAQAAEPADRWEADIVAFEQQDQVQPPARGGVVFAGSSSIRMWDLAASFPQLGALNRGFGGSQMSDLLRYVDRIVIKYEPRVVVIYEGDNDLASGESPAQVADEFRQLAERLRAQSPMTDVIFLSIKPSVARWQLYPQMQQANAKIAEYCQRHPRLHFLDVGHVLLNEQGQPRPELFADDGLHLNAAGYQRWSALAQPLIERLRGRP